MISRIVESFLRQFDNEERELIFRFRLWKHRWFPYRTAELIFPEDDKKELEIGPWRWHPPENLERFFAWLQLRSRFLIP